MRMGGAGDWVWGGEEKRREKRGRGSILRYEMKLWESTEVNVAYAIAIVFAAWGWGWGLGCEMPKWDSFPPLFLSLSLS